MSLSGSPLAKLGSSLQGSNVQHPLYNLDRGTEKHTYSLYEFHKAERMQTKYLVELPKVAVAAVIDKTPKFQQLKTIEGYFSFLQGPMQYSEGTFPLVTQRPRYLLVTICWDCRYSFPLGRLGQRKGRGYWGRFERAMLRSGAAHFCPWPELSHVATHWKWGIYCRCGGHGFWLNHSQLCLNHMKAEKGFKKG